ncbi:peptidase C14 [Epithele typhae]|uniref:peptidase C14 n=1 Tax=Epithele typhae TaxID=378194 RepID=UPI0020078C1E|nr:peptidase C14 [Epithele typhae]KAH9923400.1 peptidase C14 [Epithele typhae]
MKIGSLRRRSTPKELPEPEPLPRKQALLIGINYDRTPHDQEYAPLSRARQDTKDFRDLLISKYGYDPENIVMMLDEDGIAPNLEPTRANILYQIRKMVANARAGSRYVFFFSGHSGQVATARPEEDDGFDEFLVPIDHARHIGADEKTTNKRMVLDNELRRRLVDPLPTGAHLTAIFDSCHSGTMLDLDHYLCNAIYSPLKSPGLRRYKSKWQQVRRRDGQRISQSGVRIVTRKLSQSDNDHGDAARENSTCGVRIYQRSRLSEDEVEVRTTAVDFADVKDGTQRKYSLRTSTRRTSIRPGTSLGDVAEGLSTASLVTFIDEEEIDRRCSSPTSLTQCNGFCDVADKPAEGATVLSIASCQDSHMTFESNRGSFTHWLIQLLQRNPHQPISRFIRDLSDKMSTQADRAHAWSQKRKESWKRKHPVEASSSSATTETGSSESCSTLTEAPRREVTVYETWEPHPLDHLDFTSIPQPQLGAQHRLDLEQPIML